MSIHTNPLRTAYRRGSIPVLCAIFAGCGSGGSNSPSAPQTSIYAGDWTGTVDTRPLRFTVNSAGEVFAVSVVLVVSYLTAGSNGTANAVLCPVPFSSGFGIVRVNGNTFEITALAIVGSTPMVPAPSTAVVSTVVRGTFSAATSASGTVDAFSITSGCGSDTILAGAAQDSRTWQATRS